MAQTAAVAQSSRSLSKSLARKPALKSIVLSGAMTAVLVARNTNDGPAWRVSLVLAAAITVGASVVFALIVPRTTRRQSARASARWSLFLGVTTVLSVGVFWMALSPIFAFGAFALAADARDRSSATPRLVRLGVALAGLGLIASLALALL